MHRVCQTLRAKIEPAEQCSAPILVLRAEHRMLDEDARTRRPDEKRDSRERGVALDGGA